MRSPDEVCKLARASLQRFHLVRLCLARFCWASAGPRCSRARACGTQVQCDSSFQLLATLRTLKPLLSKLQAAPRQHMRHLLRDQKRLRQPR